MAKGVKYICTNCGNRTLAWSGKCSICHEWNTIVEDLDNESSLKTKSKGKILTVSSLKGPNSSVNSDRIKTNETQIDDVLGGGFVKGSVVLLAGEPGIGKSTLLLQIANLIAKSKKVLYLSGEESEGQVSLRAKRLAIDSEDIDLVSSSSADDAASTIATGEYDLAIIDSVQTMQTSSVVTAMGTVSQITNVTHILSSVAKSSGTVLLLVGHVTKEGNIAGPKVLEHSVDVVLQLEGDRYGGFKILRSVKNRYGSTNEAGIFEMKDNGLMAVENPSASLLAERQVVDGSIVFAVIEGSRAVLVEIQALVNKTAYGYPKRACSGYDLNRLNLLIAMLERRTKLNLSDKDVYINVVGGIKINEHAADLAICMAIGSAVKGLKLKSNCVVFGEVGLSGEVRHVPMAQKRIEEASKMGFDGAIGPKLRENKSKVKLHQVSDVRSALNTFLEKE
jgi:DNA repair protein RadA/Sms